MRVGFDRFRSCPSSRAGCFCVQLHVVMHGKSLVWVFTAILMSWHASVAKLLQEFRFLPSPPADGWLDGGCILFNVFLGPCSLLLVACRRWYAGSLLAVSSHLTGKESYFQTEWHRWM